MAQGKMRMDGQEKRVRGRVVFYRSKAAYGFIQGDDGRDYFVHVTQILETCGPVLRTGDEVDFVPVDQPKGPAATKVRRVTTADEPYREVA